MGRPDSLRSVFGELFWPGRLPGWISPLGRLWPAWAQTRSDRCLEDSSDFAGSFPEGCFWGGLYSIRGRPKQEDEEEPAEEEEKTEDKE